MASKVVLVTGAAKRIGAVCAQYLHAEGFNVVLHCHRSENAAEQLADRFNHARSGSAVVLKADLTVHSEVLRLAQAAVDRWGGLDALVNNAAQFQATEFGQINEADWLDLMNSNLKAPFFLAQTVSSALARRAGTIVNIADIHSERGLPGYSVYSIAKAGLVAMTKVLARELAPQIRVNAVSPGAILWPEHETYTLRQTEILQKVPLQRCGTVDDIAKAVVFLIQNADYVTGQVLSVDGGRLLFS